VKRTLSRKRGQSCVVLDLPDTSEIGDEKKTIKQNRTGREQKEMKPTRETENKKRNVARHRKEHIALRERPRGTAGLRGFSLLPCEKNVIKTTRRKGKEKKKETKEIE